MDIKEILNSKSIRNVVLKESFKSYESDDETFTADAYSVKGYKGIAFHVLGWEVEPNEDTDFTGSGDRTGKVVVVMIGDDRKHVVDFDDLIPINSDEYCGSCGQIGCQCDKG